MANYYMLFSEVLPDLNAAELAWIEAVLHRDNLDGQDEDHDVDEGGSADGGGDSAVVAAKPVDPQTSLEPRLENAGIDVGQIELEDWPGFEWEFEPAAPVGVSDRGAGANALKSLWLHAD